MQKLLADTRFYSMLLDLDWDLARSVRDMRCECKGPLHVSHYPRRPRGGPPDLPEGYERRFSFSCYRCRSRTTPPSVRFLGRRWYLAAVVVLVSAFEQGVSSRRVAAVRKWLGDQIDRRTLQRWRRWWLETFPASRTWAAGRGGFVPPVAERRLPMSLINRFQGDDRERLTATLRFVSPVTTSSCAHSLVGSARR